MKAINYYIVLEKIKEKNATIAGLSGAEYYRQS